MSEKNSAEVITDPRYLLPAHNPVLNNGIIIEKPGYNSPEEILSDYKNSVDALELLFRIELAGGRDNYISRLGKQKLQVLGLLEEGELSLNRAYKEIEAIKNEIKKADSLITNPNNYKLEILEYLSKKKKLLENNFVVGGEWWER